MLLLYGSTGHTGALIAEEAARRKVPCINDGALAAPHFPITENRA